MIDRKKIRLRYELASGQFGEVYKGKLLTICSHELTILKCHKDFNKLGQVSFVLSRSAHRTPNFINPEFRFPQI